MLDEKAKTTERVMAALGTAFARWNARDPANNTKASLARQCAAITGHPCTPQTVGQWFKTGRMDKRWLAAVESIFGESLGFSAARADWPFTLVKRERWERLSEQERGSVQEKINRALAEFEAAVTGPVDLDHARPPMRRTTMGRWKGKKSGAKTAKKTRGG